MRITLVNLLVICLLMAIWGHSDAAVKGSDFFAATYLSSAELSWDTDPMAYLPAFQPVYLGVDFSTNPLLPHLQAIKYHVWSQGWPDVVYQGFGVACWKMLNGLPEAIVWPASGVPLYNPNTAGNWIIQTVDPYLHLDILCPQGFMVGVYTLYTFPENDALSIDNQGPGPHDWSSSGSGWMHPAYGHLCIRAFIDDWGDWGVIEPGTIGRIKAFYR